MTTENNTANFGDGGEKTPAADQDIAALFDLGRHPEKWPGADADTLTKLTYLQCLDYGLTGDPAKINPLGDLYLLLVERTSTEDRQELLGRVSDAVQECAGSINSFLPFIFSETDPGIISTACLDMAQLAPLEDGDELTGPKLVMNMGTEQTENQAIRAGAYTGVLLLGDRRTLPLLKGCWRRLNSEGRSGLATAWSGFVYAGVIDFYLDWLEDAEEADFGAIAGTLARMASSPAVPKVLDVERKLPANTQDEQPPIKLINEWTIEEYGRIIEPRLRDLARRESEPKVIPLVLEAWGLPVTAVSFSKDRREKVIERAINKPALGGAAGIFGAEPCQICGEVGTFRGFASAMASHWGGAFACGSCRGRLGNDGIRPAVEASPQRYCLHCLSRYPKSECIQDGSKWTCKPCLEAHPDDSITRRRYVEMACDTDEKLALLDLSLEATVLDMEETWATEGTFNRHEHAARRLKEAGEAHGVDYESISERTIEEDRDDLE